MPLMRQNAVVPFGKYKGQPVEQLAADPEYCEWLMGQSWFVEKYQAIHTVIINNFGEPSETPEHNRLQLRFLDETFRRQCTQAICHPRHGISELSLPEFEMDGLDVVWRVGSWHRTQKSSRGFGYAPLPDDPQIWKAYYNRVGIECKPSLGDDYPAVLRALKRLPLKPYSAYICVIAEEVRSQAGSLAQLKTFFRQSEVSYRCR